MYNTPVSVHRQSHLNHLQPVPSLSNFVSFKDENGSANGIRTVNQFDGSVFARFFLTVCGCGTKEGKLYETVHCGVKCSRGGNGCVTSINLAAKVMA